MGDRTKTIRVNQDVEFDVLIDGTHHRRVSEGLLVTFNGDDTVCYAGRCGKELMFRAMYCFTNFIIDNNLEDEFDSYLKSCFAKEMIDL